MIELTNVSKRFGRKAAVTDLSLHVQRGEVFAFLGANGAGKTTTIKMLVGLLQPDVGRIRIGTSDAVHQPRQASQLTGYVPDQPFLYDKLTGREFLQFIAELRGMSTANHQQAIDEVIRTFRLESFIDELSESYSHGMKQRVVFAAALVHRPPVVILDEPMVGLDPLHMRVVKDVLRQLADGGTTVFMSTHTLSLAEEIADRLCVIKDGQLQFVGTVSDLRQQRQRAGETLEQLFLEMTS